MAALIVLEILLAGITVLSFFVNKKKALAPSFIFSVVFLISCTFALIGNGVLWKEEISFLTVAIIVSSLLVFIVGEYMSKKLYAFLSSKWKEKHKTDNSEDKETKVEPENRLFISKKLIIVLSVIFVVSLLVLYFEFKEDVKIAVIYGYRPYKPDLIYYVRIAEQAGTRVPIYVSIFSLFFMYLGVMFVFLFLYVFFNSSKPVECLMFVPQLIPTVLFMFLSTSRVNYILFFVMFVVSIFIITTIINYKTYKPLVIAIIINAILVFTLAFVLVGIYRRTMFNGGSMFENILLYAGSPIVAFNKVLLETKDASMPFASTSFSGVYYFIHRIFPSAHPGYPFDAHVVFNNGQSTNVYPIFRAWIYDFGIMPSYLISFAFGVFNGFVYNVLINKKKAICFVSFYYCYLMYCLTLSVISKNGTSTIMTWSRIMFFIVGLFVVLFDRYVINKKYKFSFRDLL